MTIFEIPLADQLTCNTTSTQSDWSLQLIAATIAAIVAATVAVTIIAPVYLPCKSKMAATETEKTRTR